MSHDVQIISMRPIRLLNSAMIPQGLLCNHGQGRAIKSPQNSMPDKAAAVPALNESNRRDCGPLRLPASAGAKSFQVPGDTELRNAREKRNTTNNEKRPKVGIDKKRREGR